MGVLMQSKYVKAVPDELRFCAACGYEGSPNAGPSDDLRFYGTELLHPICREEMGFLLTEFTKAGSVTEDDAADLLRRIQL
jgi:hypothetical protein